MPPSPQRSKHSKRSALVCRQVLCAISIACWGTVLYLTPLTEAQAQSLDGNSSVKTGDGKSDSVQHNYPAATSATRNIGLNAIAQSKVSRNHPSAPPLRKMHGNSAHKAKPLANHVLIDDGAKNAEFQKAREGLLLAVKQKDKTFVVESLAPQVVTALGGGTGKENFLQTWQDLEPASPFWQKFERVLQHGAQFDSESGEFHAPAVSFDDSHLELPQAVVWNHVSGLYQLPEKGLRDQTLYGQQVTIFEPPAREPNTKEWSKICTLDGSRGYLRSKDIYSAFDEFAVFKKIDRKWLLTWFGYAEL